MNTEKRRRSALIRLFRVHPWLLLQQAYGVLEGAVVARVNVRACKSDELVRLDPGAFESHTTGSLIIKLTDIQHAAIRQRVAVSNREHAAARAAADHRRTTFCLQC